MVKYTLLNLYKDVIGSIFVRIYDMKENFLLN